MSRLIFEGDPTERFGILLPKPFIEKISVYLDSIQVDVSFHFKIEEGIEKEDFLEQTGANKLKIYVGPTRRRVLNSSGEYVDDAPEVLTDFSNEFYYNNPLSISGGGTMLVHDIEEFDSDFFYNSNGDKFIKFFATINATPEIDGYTDERRLQYYNDYFSGEECGNIISYTFFDGLFETSESFSNSSESIKKVKSFGRFLEDEFDNRNKRVFLLMKSQISELCYSKLTNKDGTINYERKIAYIEPSGLYYGRVPLMSLDRVYRKINNINHEEVSSRIQEIISEFVGEIEEANLISSVLQQKSKDPTLLISLQRNVNNFSNKSTSTTIGSLYGELVDAIVEIDSILSSSESLEKRLLPNSKIVDYRQTANFRSNDSLNFDNLDYSSFVTFYPEDYLYPIIKNIQKIKYADGTTSQSYASAMNGSDTLSYQNLVENLFDLSQDFVYYTNGYIFFDYEKAVLQQSNISRFLNTYNISQLFGKNALNEYFKIEYIDFFKKSIGSGVRTPRAVNESTLQVTPPCLHARIAGSGFGPGVLPVINTTVTSTGVPQLVEATVFQLSNPLPDGEMARRTDTTIAVNVLKEKTNFRIIRFVPSSGQGNETNYRLITINFEDYFIPHSGYENIYISYNPVFTIRDTTMQFYDYLRQIVFTEFDRLSEYYELAQEFCVYNNMDGRFNDFFADSLESYALFTPKILQSEEQSPWQTAPIAFVIMKSLLQTSYRLSEFPNDYSNTNRDFSGDLIDMDSIKLEAQVISDSISPKNGAIEFLDSFHQQFSDLKEVFELNTGIDYANEIYDNSGAVITYDLINPDDEKQFSKEEKFTVAGGTLFTEYAFGEINENDSVRFDD